jgi:hypothetical protein
VQNRQRFFLLRPSFLRTIVVAALTDRVLTFRRGELLTIEDTNGFVNAASKKTAAGCV